MSSPSASGRSNGSRLVSANAATVKMKYASASGNTFHVKSDGDCRAITSVSVTFPARSRTATVLIPIAISYEIICAEARNPHRSEDVLCDDHVDVAPAGGEGCGEGDHREREQRRHEGHGRRQQEQHLVGLRGERLRL